MVDKRLWRKDTSSSGSKGGRNEGLTNIHRLRGRETVQVARDTAAGEIAGRARRDEGVTDVLQNLVKKGDKAPARMEGPSDRGAEAHGVASSSRDDRLNKTFKNYTALHGYELKIRRENLEKRMAENPVPSSMEKDLGTFLQELPPQTVDAIPLMYSKGYETISSGTRVSSEGFDLHAGAGTPQPIPKGMQERVLEDFPDEYVYGDAQNQHRAQHIDGKFTLDEETVGRLSEAGFNVRTWEMIGEMYTRIYFEAREANLQTIKEDYDKIAAMLPPKGFSAPPNMSDGAKAFRAKRYGRESDVGDEEDFSRPTSKKSSESSIPMEDL